MGYSIHDWFEEKALPLLTTCLERINENKNNVEELDDSPSSYELFIQTMKMIFEDDTFEYRKHQFASVLLDTILGDDVDTYSKIKRCFDMLFGDEDKHLNQLIYVEGRNVVTCEFDVEKDSEE